MFGKNILVLLTIYPVVFLAFYYLYYIPLKERNINLQITLSDAYRDKNDQDKNFQQQIERLSLQITQYGGQVQDKGQPLAHPIEKSDTSNDVPSADSLQQAKTFEKCPVCTPKECPLTQCKECLPPEQCPPPQQCPVPEQCPPPQQCPSSATSSTSPKLNFNGLSDTHGPADLPHKRALLALSGTSQDIMLHTHRRLLIQIPTHSVTPLAHTLLCTLDSVIKVKRVGE